MSFKIVLDNKWTEWKGHFHNGIFAFLTPLGARFASHFLSSASKTHRL